MHFAKSEGLPDHFLKGKLSNQVKQKTDYMKSKHRSNLLLKDWSRDEYWRRQDEVLHDKVVDTIDRVSINDITAEQFLDKYERGSKPCIITGVTEAWPGKQEWKVKVSQIIVDIGRDYLKGSEAAFLKWEKVMADAS